MPNKEIFNVLFARIAMMLVEIKNAKARYASSVANWLTALIRTVKILQEMQKAGLVNFEKQEG